MPDSKLLGANVDCVNSDAMEVVENFLKGQLNLYEDYGRNLFITYSWPSLKASFRDNIILNFRTLSERMFNTDFSSIRGYECIVEVQTKDYEEIEIQEVWCVIAFPGAKDKKWRVFDVSIKESNIAEKDSIEDEISSLTKIIEYKKANSISLKQTDHYPLGFLAAAQGRLNASYLAFIKTIVINNTNPYENDQLPQSYFEACAQTLELILGVHDQ